MAHPVEVAARAQLLDEDLGADAGIRANNVPIIIIAPVGLEIDMLPDERSGRVHAAALIHHDAQAKNAVASGSRLDPDHLAGGIHFPDIERVAVGARDQLITVEIATVVESRLVLVGPQGVNVVVAVHGDGVGVHAVQIFGLRVPDEVAIAGIQLGHEHVRMPAIPADRVQDVLA